MKHKSIHIIQITVTQTIHINTQQMKQIKRRNEPSGSHSNQKPGKNTKDTYFKHVARPFNGNWNQILTFKHSF